MPRGLRAEGRLHPLTGTTPQGACYNFCMIALVSKAEIKKYVEQFPEHADCPPYVFGEVLPVLTEEAAKRLHAALKRQATRKAAKNKLKAKKG
jgi:hypothetical protein